MNESMMNAAILGLVAGIAGSLRPWMLRGVYWICRRFPPRSRARRALLGGRGYWYGPITIALVVAIFWYAGSSAQ